MRIRFAQPTSVPVLSSSTLSRRGSNIYEAALVTLDLAISYLEEGRIVEVRELAEEMVAVFRAHDVHREALAALLLFEESARRETATADLARQVATALAQVNQQKASPREAL